MPSVEGGNSRDRPPDLLETTETVIVLMLASVDVVVPSFAFPVPEIVLVGAALIPILIVLTLPGTELA